MLLTEAMIPLMAVGNITTMTLAESPIGPLVFICAPPDTHAKLAVAFHTAGDHMTNSAQ